MRRWYALEWPYGADTTVSDEAFTGPGRSRPAADVHVFQSREARDAWVCESPAARRGDNKFREPVKANDSFVRLSKAREKKHWGNCGGVWVIEHGSNDEE